MAGARSWYEVGQENCNSDSSSAEFVWSLSRFHVAFQITDLAGFGCFAEPHITIAKDRLPGFDVQLVDHNTKRSVCACCNNHTVSLTAPYNRGMSRQIHLATHLSLAELEHRYRAAYEPHERSWWQILWLLARGQTATAIADITGYNRAWIGQIAKRYNEHGPEAMVNRRHTTSWRAPRMLSAAQQEELWAALAGPAPDGAKCWRARDVADWMAAKLDRPVATQRGWDYLQRLKYSQQVPRPQHALADPEQQARFKKN